MLYMLFVCWCIPNKLGHGVCIIYLPTIMQECISVIFQAFLEECYWYTWVHVKNYLHIFYGTFLILSKHLAVDC